MKQGTRRGRVKNILYRTIAVIIISIFLPLNVYSDELISKTDDTSVDFILMLDVSGTMVGSDATDLTMEAAKLFVDMMPAENARLAILTFGNDYSKNSEQYEVSSIEDLKDEIASNPKGKNQVKLARDLEDITSRDEKEKAKTTIDAVSTKKAGDGYTPVGYALHAAHQVLVDSGANKDSAAIILLSDGRLSGQNDSYNLGWDYKSVDSAVAKARSYKWPVYCMELNYDGVNNIVGDFNGNIGRHLMREKIPESSNEHVLLSNATEAQNAFASIFAKFFDATADDDSGTIYMTNGECSKTFLLDEMIAETNITLTGTMEDMAKVTDISITEPDGTTMVYMNNIDQQDRSVTFEKQYITIKLMVPTEGEWTVTAHGSDGVTIGYYAVSIHEMDLRLISSIEEGVVPKGTTVEFLADFIYHGTPYSPSKAYTTYPAILSITGPNGISSEMTGSEQNYSASYTFEECGEYVVKAFVNNQNFFRSGVKESGSYTFSVQNLPVMVADEKIEKQIIHLNEAMEDIDCSKYFISLDDDPVEYSLAFPEEAEITGEISENGLLKLKAGSTVGDYEIVVGAKDSLMEEAVEQRFMFCIENQPMEMISSIKDGDTEKLDFSYNADTLPDYLIKLANVSKESEKTFIWSDYFIDPDDIPIKISVTEEEENDGSIETVIDEEKMYVNAKGAGSAKYKVVATDSNDENVSYTFFITAQSYNAIDLVWKVIGKWVYIGSTILLVSIITFLYANLGKKIYGQWDIISVGSKPVEKRTLAKSVAGRKKVCKLNNLLREYGVIGDFGNVELVAKNKISKTVVIRNLGGMNEVAIRNNRVQEHEKLRKMKIKCKKGTTVTLVSPKGNRVVLKRVTK